MKNGRVIAEVGIEYKEKLQLLANKNSNGNISELLRKKTLQLTAKT